MKSDPVEKQSIDSGETPLSRNVLSLVGTPQVINSTRVLSIRNESKSDPTKEQSIDSNKTPLFKSVLNLAGIL